MSFTISTAHNNARLQATIAFADSGVANSCIKLFDGDDTLLVTMVLAKPCGAIVSNVVVLEQADPGGDQILTQGVAVRAEWVNGDDDLVGDGEVTFAGDTDPVTGLYPFKVTGTAGTLLYAGAYAKLGLTALG